MDDPARDVTAILGAWRAGESGALDRLIPLVYDELRSLAEGYLRRERPDHTLQATAVLHEAYLRLVEKTHPNWEGRVHFFAVAAQVMRRILVDHARERRAAKRGGEAAKVSLDADPATEDEAARVLAVSPATVRLDLRLARAWLLTELGGTGHGP